MTSAPSSLPAGSHTADTPGTAVFIQAPADVPYALSICERAALSGAPAILAVVNVRPVFECLRGITLPVQEIVFIPYNLQPLPVAPRKIRTAKRELERRYEAIFGARKIGQAYFFAAHSDAVTAYFVLRLSRQAKVYLADHCGLSDPLEDRWPLRLFAKWLVLRYITGISFDFWNRQDTTFDAARYGIGRTQVEPSARRLPRPADFTPKVVLLDSNDETNPLCEGYAEMIVGFVRELALRGVTVGLKGHPRLGHSRCLDSFRLTELPAGCPMELFDLSGIRAVISLVSTAVARSAGPGCAALSLVRLVRFHDPSHLAYYEDYLSGQSGGRVAFPDSAAEAAEIVARAVAC